MQIPFEVQTAWKHWLEGSNCQPITGGLSSSRVWRVETALGQHCCLKAWPNTTINQYRLSELHQFMAALGGGLNFIPRIISPSTISSASFLQQSGYYWELSTWLSGKPLQPDDAQLTHGNSAVQSIVQIHQASRNWMSTVGSSPSVATRIEVLKGYRERLPTLRRLTAGSSSPLDQLMQETLGHFEHSVISLIEQLDRLSSPVELLWVVRDLHREHMLFQETTVTGIIDFGAARLDEPLIDLVRLLGSLWPLNRDMRHQLVEDYASFREQSGVLPRYLVLDHSSTLLSAMQWLQWLGVEQRSFAVEQHRLIQRWQQLNQRLDCNQW